MKKIIYIFIPVVIIIVAAFVFFTKNQKVTVQPVPTQTSNVNVKTFTINGSNFDFVPATITVNKGEAVKIIFKNNSGKHDLVIDGYNVSTKTINGGSEDSVQFVADKTGTFEYYCSVGNHKDLGMTGTLTVQ